MPPKRRKGKKGRKPNTKPSGKRVAAAEQTPASGKASQKVSAAAEAEESLEDQLSKLQLSDGPSMQLKEDDDSLQCTHGYVALPDGHIGQDIIAALTQTLDLAGDLEDLRLVLQALQSSSQAFPNVWENAHTMERINSFFISRGVQFVLEGKEGISLAAVAFLVNVIEQRRACRVLRTQETPKMSKFLEVANGDTRTLISFFRKHIPCKCLDERYREAKALKKTGTCGNAYCSLPEGEGGTKCHAVLFSLSSSTLLLARMCTERLEFPRTLLQQNDARDEG